MRLLIHDLREAVRTLRKEPRFLVIASLTLALGIGAVTSIFSVVNGVLLRPLPNPDADRLVNVKSTATGLGFDEFPLSPDIFVFYRRHNTVFEDMALFQDGRSNVTDSGAPEVVDSAATTHSYFATLGVAFSRGRSYSESEDRPQAAKVAVISHRLWTRRYGADPKLLGRTVRIDGDATEIVGIAPPWLDRAGSPELWLPTRFDPANLPIGNFGWSAVARLKPHVTADQATTHLGHLVRRAMEELIHNETYRAFLKEGHYRPLVRSMKDDLIGDVRQPLWILLGTVAMVLLVACGNVANLCLVRADTRQREIAIRVALGGTRAALVRKLLAEALVLAAVGCGLGVLLAAAAVPALLRLAPSTIPRLDQVQLDATVLLFAAAAAVVSAVIFGVVPAIRYTRPDSLAALRQGGRSATDHPTRQRGRRLLVVAQTAMALVLLVGAGLLARSFSRLMGAELGFVPHDVMTFRVALPVATYPKSADVARFSQQLVDRLAELPAIEAAGAITEVPLASHPSGTAFEFSGHPLAPGQMPPLVWHQGVTAGYFKTLRVPFVRGRDFDSSDRREGVRSVIVDRTLADRYWPGQDPIGKQLRTSDSDKPQAWFTVVGVVGSVRHGDLREPFKPLIYRPLTPFNENPPRALSYVVRGPRVAAQVDALRQSVWAIDRDLPVAAVRSMDEIVERSVVQFSFTMLTLSLAAVIALLLGTVGLYGVLSYAVSLRTREIGVRLALGASPSRVMRSVVANGAMLTMAGLVVGSLGAAALTRFLSGLLYETQPLDVLTFTAMPAILLIVALIASYLPARRAAGVSPMEAMRAE